MSEQDGYVELLNETIAILEAKLAEALARAEKAEKIIQTIAGWPLGDEILGPALEDDVNWKGGYENAIKLARSLDRQRGPVEPKRARAAPLDAPAPATTGAQSPRPSASTRREIAREGICPVFDLTHAHRHPH